MIEANVIIENLEIDIQVQTTKVEQLNRVEADQNKKILALESEIKKLRLSSRSKIIQRSTLKIDGLTEIVKTQNKAISKLKMQKGIIYCNSYIPLQNCFEFQ